jgi:hypothetical protein
MRARIMIALMAVMPLYESQYAPVSMSAVMRFFQTSLMFRSMLGQQPDFGPMESQQSQQVQTCNRHALFA